MLNLAEYRSRSTSLSDYLPWACLVAPGIVLNKDGSFQRTIRYRGPDLDSATDAELVAVSARLNNVLKRFGEGWALFFEAERLPADSYPGARFADAASWLVDKERFHAFSAIGAHHESKYFLTFLYLPPPERAARAERFLYERTEGAALETNAFAQLAWFETETTRALDLLATLLPEAAALSDTETLTYLHGTISRKRHTVAVPAVPTHLDAVLCDTPLLGGVEPKLGDAHLRMLTVLGFPNTTTPGVLDALNDLGFSYRWMTRWLALDKTDANKHLTKLRRQWFAKRKSVGAVLREALFNRETALIDPDAENKALDADAALQELGSDDVAFGYLTTTIVVADTDPNRANEKLLAVERIINGRGFVTIRETLNAVEAWLGSLPGNPYANVRQPIVHSLNLAHLMPASAVWAGSDNNNHLNAPVLMLTETRGSTPFRLDLHVGDVGHTLVVGPTGAGKSVLLSLLTLQFRRYIGAQVVIFDRGRSARAAVLAMEGTAIELGLDGTLALQPLARIDEPGELAFALDWVIALLAAEGLTITPDIKHSVWTALQSLASAPKAERTLTGLAVLVQSSAVSAALSPYTLEGAYGRLLDGASETLTLSDIVHFEMEPLMQHKALIAPVLTYLFHRLEARFGSPYATGHDTQQGTRPTLLILDEAWTFLDNPLFAVRIREWLKTLRKKNVAVVFATQSLTDIERSSIAPALIESCPTRIFLPNDRALEPQARAIYARFGLNDRQVEILATAAPKRDYYAQTARGNRLFALGLGPIALALCGSSTPDDHRLMDGLTASVATKGQAAVQAALHPMRFAEAFLRAKRLPWAADALMAFPGATPALTAPPQLSQSEMPHSDADRITLPSHRIAPNTPITDSPQSASQTNLDFDDLLPARFSPYRISPKPNRAARRRASRAIALALAISLSTVIPAVRPALAITVFDPLNYQENVLAAVRALEQINIQVRQLQNQAQALMRMEQNLQRLGATMSPDLQRSLADIQTRLQDGEGLALKLRDTEAGFAQLYPKDLASALSTDDQLRTVKSRWDEEYAALKRSALLQGQIADGIGRDTRLLDDAMTRSRAAAGALDVTQAGNELTGLHVKQTLQLQGLIAAQYRSDTLGRARDLALAGEARQRFKTFLGTANAYKRSP